MEVLVSVAVTSIGLLGMTALTIVSTRVNHDAYIKTQVNFIAQAFIESMHINASAVAAGRYDGRYGDDSARDPGCWTHGCSPAERAEYDRARFDNALHATLPNPAASVKCTAAGPGATHSPAIYDGTCRLEIAWSDRPMNAGGDGRNTPLVWFFEP